MKIINYIFICVTFALSLNCEAQKKKNPKFSVIAFYTAKNDAAHINFVEEANTWFGEMAKKNNFFYNSTSDWNVINKMYLSQYQVVIFLDSRPEDPKIRTFFEDYIKEGGAWMGFHFAAFAKENSEFPQNWDWYHNEFLGSGEYVSNTWRPTSAILKVEKNNAFTAGIPETFSSAPNEWYRWKNDLTKNPDIEILLSIDKKSFPLGTGPKKDEIWKKGYYPVVWTNKKYKMIYFNMGHNDMDYEGGTNKPLSQTFSNETEAKLILNGLLSLGGDVQKK